MIRPRPDPWRARLRRRWPRAWRAGLAVLACCAATCLPVWLALHAGRR